MDRQIGIGPGALLLQVTSTSSAQKASAWQHYGPILANKITVGRSPTVAGVTHSSTASTITFEGMFSSTAATGVVGAVSSTHAIVTIAVRAYANRATYIASTVALAINYIRMRSSGSTGTSALQYGYVMGVP